jgi:hypothetical protein
MTDVAGECNRLNEISQPLGYAVTATTSVDDQSTQQFTIHRLDQTVASGPTFATIEEVRAHLEAIAKLPLWRLDLANNSAIVFDSAELEITDPSTGESFSFRGGVTQHSTAGVRGIAPGRAGQTPGTTTGRTQRWATSPQPTMLPAYTR